MPPRTRRSAAVAAAALIPDMQLESDEEMEKEVDVEEEEQDVDEGDDDAEAEEEEDMDEEQLIEYDDPIPSKVAQQPPKLKITLKLPANNASSNSAGTATPDDAELDYVAFKRTPKRRAKAKVIHDNDIESEDPSSPSDSDGGLSTQGVLSRSTGTPTVSTRPLTTRQAVLASMVDPSHVSLNESSRSKKQPLNETELALRREETARKRKNLSEKRLEDEKAETINRLLKKQSRPKNKRTNTTDSPLPPSGSRTPKPKVKTGEEGGEEGEGDEDEDEVMEFVDPPEEVRPTMYRWVSSFRELPGQGQCEDKQAQMAITFSVPESVFLPPGPLEVHRTIMATNSETAMQIDIHPPDPGWEGIRVAKGPGMCAIEGCGRPRKYRVPKNWTIGACGSDHLRALSNQA